MVNLLFLDRRNRTTRPSWNCGEQTHTPRFLLGPLLESPGMWHLSQNMWMYIPRKLKTASRVSWDKMGERGKYSHAFLIGGDSLYCIVLAIIACLTPGIVPVFLCIKDWGDIQEVVFSVQFISVTQLCPTLCDRMNRSTPGLPVHHQLPKSTQTHVH